jgi:hypothetical protein
VFRFEYSQSGQNPLSGIAHPSSISTISQTQAADRILRQNITGAQQRGSSAASVHPNFRQKSVCFISCKFCQGGICKRGMKAILLADTRVELFSTDRVPANRVQLVEEDYTTSNCNCKIGDVACLGCGNVIGYHVVAPCDLCMSACNNGHFWMFHADMVNSKDRLRKKTGTLLQWCHLEKEEATTEKSEFLSR